MHKIFNSHTRKKFWIFSYIQKQDQVNNANSAFILINLLISQGCQNGLIGQGGLGGPGGQGGQGGSGWSGSQGG